VDDGRGDADVAGGDDATADVEHRLAGVQRAAAPGHLLPARAGLRRVGGLAVRPAAELQQRVGRHDQGVGLAAGHRLRLGRREQRHQLGHPRRGHRGLVDAAHHHLGGQAGLAQELQPRRGPRGQHDPPVGAPA
jgi:hypothetical protein